MGFWASPALGLCSIAPRLGISMALLDLPGHLRAKQV